jgi:hypothetical protein
MTLPLPARRRPSWARISGLALLGAAATMTTSAFGAPTPRECASASEDSLALRKQEKLGAAKEKLLLCANPACPAEIRDECGHELSEVAGAMPSVVFDVKDAAGNDVSAVRVTMDGAPLVDHLGAEAVSIDPGEHVFRFEPVPPSPAVERSFVVREGERNRHLSVTLGGAAGADHASGSSRGGRKTIALVMGGVGIVGIGVGAAFGVMAMSSWNSAKSDCGSLCSPTSHAVSEKSTASSQATISTVGFVAGGLLAAGAAALWFTTPSGNVQVGPSAGANGAGMALRGVF